MLRNWVCSLVVVAGLFSSVGQAALLGIDDSDPGFMTFTWSGFDNGGLSIDGSTPTVAGILVLPDAGYSLSGSWLDSTPGGSELVTIYFALAGFPTDVTSGVIADVIYDGIAGTLVGTSSVGGYVGFPYFTGSPTFLQDGHTEAASTSSVSPGLALNFDSEGAAVVPEPATLSLVGLGAMGLVIGAYRRRRQVA